MQPSSVRLIPTILDKLFYHIAPADGIVCQNACKLFDLFANQQVWYRLAAPKNRMLLLAWPFCMHAGEHASNRYKQAEFYDILRVNVNAGRLHYHTDAVDEKMREFLAGFESFVLHCVLSNIDLYTELTVLMLDFHVDKLYVGDVFDDPKPERYQWFLSKSLVQLKSAAAAETMNTSKKPDLFLDPELWSKAINAVVAQCASTLRHFVFCSSRWLRENFYTSLKLDCMLAQLEQLETLYMPSFEKKCVHAYYTDSGSRRLCWQALNDLPSAKRSILPNLRRIVAIHPFNHKNMLVFIRDGDTNVGTKFIELFSSTSPPQFHHTSPKLPIELVLVAGPSLDGQNKRYIESMGRHHDDMLPNFAIYVRDTDVLMLSQHTLYSVMSEHGCKNHDTFRDNIPAFRYAVEKLLLKVVHHSRPHMLSVISDLRIGRKCKKATIPASIGITALAESAPETVALVLNTLSRRLSWPLSLTLELDWLRLLKHLPLFAVVTSTTSNDAASLHWMTCFPRGKLKFCLSIREGLQECIAVDSRHSNSNSMSPNMWSNICAETRYSFPLQVTIDFHPPPMEMLFGKTDTLQSIRKYFIHCMRKFVNDVRDHQPFLDNRVDLDILLAIRDRSRSLRADLYASCQVLIVTLCIHYDFWRADKSEVPGKRSEDVRRIERQLYDKRLEQELLREFYARRSVLDRQQQLFVLPNLKSISFVREVFG